MMKQIALLMFLALAGDKSKPCGASVPEEANQVKPQITATVDSASTAEFMNGLSIRCPEGYRFNGQKLAGGSYKDMFNQVQTLVCYKERAR